MKNNICKITLAASITIVCAILCFTGCASMNAQDQEPLLSAAGFRAHIPDTAAQREAFERLPPYKVQRARDNGKTLYVYKDKKEGIVYVGSETQYQRYQQLAVQKDIAEDYYQAAEMNREASLGWYDAFPRSYLW